MMARRPAIIITFGSLVLTVLYVNFPQNLQKPPEEAEAIEVVPDYTFGDLDALLCSKELGNWNGTLRPCPKHGIATMIPGGRTGERESLKFGKKNKIHLI